MPLKKLRPPCRTSSLETWDMRVRSEIYIELKHGMLTFFWIKSNTFISLLYFLWHLMQVMWQFLCRFPKSHEVLGQDVGTVRGAEDWSQVGQGSGSVPNFHFFCKEKCNLERVGMDHPSMQNRNAGGTNYLGVARSWDKKSIMFLCAQSLNRCRFQTYDQCQCIWLSDFASCFG